MKLLSFIVTAFFIIGCINKKPYTNIEKNVYSKEEMKIINTNFKADTSEKEMQAIVIQTH